MVERVRANLRSVIRGKDDRIDLLLAALLAQGHVLIEDLPGLGKTTLAKALALSLDAMFRRVQFTPDLLPTDVLGGSVYNSTEGSFAFHKGPIFTNILLADEINRASPRTQSSLLEAMGENQATIEGVRHALPTPFMVIATQNPIEFHGTYPLPEAQLDRFLVHMDLDYADADTERMILFDQQREHPLNALTPVVECQAVERLQAKVRQVHVAQEIGRYIVELVRATRGHPQVQMGASPRGALGLFRMAQATALMAGRDHVVPDDVQQTAGPVLAHRMMLETKARYGGADKKAVIAEVIEKTRVPT
ncbi:MAG: AAA domain-containing protein [Planctomycetes bacterium]|nr:AAA domain-containing protein [Planctomycetota bacterium]